MPDVKPRPKAGAIRLSFMGADQKGMRSASVVEVVACILLLAFAAGVQRNAILTPRLDGFITAFARTVKKLEHEHWWSASSPIWLVHDYENL